MMIKHSMPRGINRHDIYNNTSCVCPTYLFIKELNLIIIVPAGPPFTNMV